jgi:predicted ATP-grasp superfamily ATP-dependent carboligase
LLGVTRQLVGEPWLHAPRFGYCGSIGPLVISTSEEMVWKKLGRVLVQWAGLQDWFGVDAIVRDGVPWVVEVNPRYTASVEVIEYGRSSPVAKAVYYAPRTITIPAHCPWETSVRAAIDDTMPEYADIPRAGSVIRRGRPVVTIFGEDEAELRGKARVLDTLFGLEDRQ